MSTGFVCPFINAIEKIAKSGHIFVAFFFLLFNETG